MSTPQRVRVQGDLYHGRVPDGAVYVGRKTPSLKASAYANPYRVGREAPDAGTAVAMFEAAVSLSPTMVVAIQRDLRGRDLACWCKPDQPCHGDVLLAIANGPTGDRFTERHGPQPTVVNISLTVDGEPTDDDRAAAVALVRAGLHEDEVGLGAVLRSVGETGNAAAMFGSVLGMCIKLGVLAFGSIEAFDEELVERLDDLQAREVEG